MVKGRDYFKRGAGSCKLCTRTHDQLLEREIVIQGFPISRHVSGVLQMFGEILLMNLIPQSTLSLLLHYIHIPAFDKYPTHLR